MVRAVNGRIPVIANVGDNCTADTVYFAQDAAKQGVDGFMRRALLQQAPAGGLYQPLQDHCGFHGHAHHPAQHPRTLLHQHGGRHHPALGPNCDNVVAIKEASGNFDQIKYIIDNAPAGDVYSGDDSSTLDIMELGGVGVISTIGNVAPDRMKAIVDLAAKGRVGCGS